MNQDTEDDLMHRVKRIETRVVRGFEELGVRIQDDSDWISVDHVNCKVVMRTLGKSVLVLRAAMVRAGCTRGMGYALYFNDDYIGSMKV